MNTHSLRWTALCLAPLLVLAPFACAFEHSLDEDVGKSECAHCHFQQVSQSPAGLLGLLAATDETGVVLGDGTSKSQLSLLNSPNRRGPPSF